MAPIKTAWTRLIRFVAAETSQIHLGQPIDTSLDIGKAAHAHKEIRAHEITGSSAFDTAATLTERVLTVQTLLTPIPHEQAGVVRCLGINYADHATETNITRPNAPIVFLKPPTALTDPFSTITIPLAAQPVEHHQPDFEVELVAVMGKAAKNVPESEILDYVLGYTCGNDVSFRFHQMNVSQWTFSKGFDEATPIGPCIVAAHALPDPQTLGLKALLNGEIMQNGHTKDQLFTVAQALSHLSQGTTLLPGSMLMTGTPAGVGFTRKPPVVIRHGDVVEVSIEGGIGTLINRFTEEGKE